MKIGEFLTYLVLYCANEYLQKPISEFIFELSRKLIMSELVRVSFQLKYNFIEVSNVRMFPAPRDCDMFSSLISISSRDSLVERSHTIIP